MCMCVRERAGYANHEVAQAFSHYSWVVSGGQYLVCDIQGVGLTWTDPQVMCVDLHGHDNTERHTYTHTRVRRHTDAHRYTHTCAYSTQCTALSGARDLLFACMLYVLCVQVNSVHRSYGQCDLGHEGIHAFFASHRCNVLCRHLNIQGCWPRN